MNKKTVIDGIIGLILGVGLMLSVIYLVPKEAITKFLPTSSTGSIVFFISIFVGPFIAIFLHELGHLLAGLLQQFKLQIFVVAFFGLKRVNDKVVPFFNKEVQYFGGIAATSPQKISPQLKNQFAIILLSGPLFSLFFGIIFLLLFTYTDSIFNSTFALIGLISIGLFFATTVPEKSGIFFTDRKRFQRLIGKGKTAVIEQCFIETTSQLLIDGHYKNIDLNKVKLIKTDEEPVIQFWGCYYTYMYYQEVDDKDKIIESRNQLQSYQNLIPKTIWKALDIK